MATMDPSKTSIAEKLAREVDASGRMDVPPAAPAGAPAPEPADDRMLEHILPGQHLSQIPVDRIAPAPEGQARKDFGEERLKALAESLKRSGVREPIIVTPHGAEPGSFQIVAGERRWRAAQLAGLTVIPCIVDPGLADRKDKLLAQAEENLHRENLNPVEEAAVLAQLMEVRQVGLKEAGDLIGKSQNQAKRLLQLHGAAAPIKRAVARGQLDARSALELVRVYNKLARADETPTQAQALKRIDTLVERVVREAWSFRKLEQYAAKLAGHGDGESPAEASGLGAAEGAAPAAGPGAEAGRAPIKQSAAFDEANGRLVIDLQRIERREVSSEEREALIIVLEKVLGQLQRL